MQLSELDWAYVQERAGYFTGRGWVFACLNQFLDGPPGVFLLTGEPGTGKTAVAAQLALAAAGRVTPAATPAARGTRGTDGRDRLAGNVHNQRHRHLEQRGHGHVLYGLPVGDGRCYWLLDWVDRGDESARLHADPRHHLLLQRHGQ